MPTGIILKGIGGFYYVWTEESLYECKARGIFRKDDTGPVPGDRVVFSILDEEKKLGSLDEINPRVSRLLRPAIANVGQIIIVISVKSPDPDILLLDKLLITSERAGISSIICINKLDLDSDGESERISKIYSSSGYRTIETCSKTGVGFEILKAELTGKISVFAGQSGVGKSTILNHMMKSVVMKTGTLSEKIGRGKHTTRHAELIPLGDGAYIADTPGFSSFELENMDPAELQTYYPEFENVKGDCRFTGCNHLSEPDCRIKDAVDAGEISVERYRSYAKLFEMLRQTDLHKYKKNH